jgi:hypothetical protein
MFAKIGVDRRAKSRALDKLESLGIISVEHRSKKSPVVGSQTAAFAETSSWLGARPIMSNTFSV